MRRGPALVGTMLVAVSLVGLGIRLLSSPTGRGRQVDGPSLAVHHARAFHAGVRQSLVPLLADAPRLDGLIREVSSGLAPKPAVAEMAADWARHFTEAEGRVGRLDPSAALPHGIQARSSYQAGAALFAEAARAVPRLVTAEGGDPRREVLKALRRLRILGDRTLDAGNRLLGDRHDESAVEIKRILPPEVPDFGTLGLRWGVDKSGPVLAELSGAAETSIHPERWLSAHRHHLQEAAHALAESAAQLSAPGPPHAVHVAAERLTALSEALAGAVPTTAGREGVHLVRLSLLVAAEAFQSLSWGNGDEAGEQARRLHRIAVRLWTLGGDLLVSGAVGTAAVYALPERPPLDVSSFKEP